MTVPPRLWMFSRRRAASREIERRAGSMAEAELAPFGTWVDYAFLAVMLAIGLAILRLILQAVIFAWRLTRRERVGLPARVATLARQIVAAAVEGVRVKDIEAARGRIALDVDGAAGELSLSGSPRRVQFRVECRSPGSLLLAPGSPLTRSFAPLLGFEHSRLEDVAFDNRFLMKAHPVHWVRGFLDPPTRETLHRLATLSHTATTGETLRLTIGPAGLALSCDAEALDFDEWLGQCVRLVRQLRMYEAPGVAWTEPSASPSNSGRCPVCAEELCGPPLVCADCRTPHHADCWVFQGGCAMFACGCNRWTTAG